MYGSTRPRSVGGGSYQSKPVETPSAERIVQSLATYYMVSNKVAASWLVERALEIAAMKEQLND